jgi:DDE domain
MVLPLPSHRFLGATIDFLLSALRDAAAAKRLFRQALRDPSHPQPRVINTDQARLYGAAIAGLKAEGTLRRRCRHRPVQYLNAILEQDHRAIKPTSEAKQGFRAFDAARRTLAGYEAIHMIRKGQARGGQQRCRSPAESVHRPAVRSGCLKPRRPVPLGTSSVTVSKLQHFPLIFCLSWRSASSISRCSSYFADFFVDIAIGGYVAYLNRRRRRPPTGVPDPRSSVPRTGRRGEFLARRLDWSPTLPSPPARSGHRARRSCRDGRRAQC